MKALILNDSHRGVVRAAGTTPLTALKLQDYLNESFASTIMSHLDKHLILNGDLLDQFEIPMSELLKVYRDLDTWLEHSDPEATLYLLSGNHDLSAKAERVSSFEFLCQILAANHTPHKFRYVLMGGLTKLYPGVWALPHVPNQDLLEVELQKALEKAEGTLLLHCNYDNNFAAQADHSLNLSEEWADKLIEKGLTLVIAHEHQKRVLKGGRIYITGNQWPSSIADCLGNDEKFAHILHEDGTIEPILTQKITGEGGCFVDVPWTELSLEIDRPFVRVSGKVKSDQASDVIQAIAKFRAKSQTLVVSNAVKIEGLEGLEDMEEISLEQVKAFDVFGELLELLDHPERKVVRELMEKEA